jgi:hypothetical protein
LCRITLPTAASSGKREDHCKKGKENPGKKEKREHTKKIKNRKPTRTIRITGVRITPIALGQATSLASKAALLQSNTVYQPGN